MARLLASVRVLGSLAAGTPETMLQLVAPANHRVALVGYGVNCRPTGVQIPSIEPPGVVDLLRQTTAGTMISAGTPNKLDPSLSEAVQTNALGSISGAEPTPGGILRTFTVNFQGSVWVRDAYDDEIVIGGGDRLGMRLTFATALGVRVAMEFEE